jgi:hypothetical protein
MKQKKKMKLMELMILGMNIQELLVRIVHMNRLKVHSRNMSSMVKEKILDNKTECLIHSSIEMMLVLHSTKSIQLKMAHSHCMIE